MRLTLDAGGHVDLIETDGDRVVVLATRPSPPGSPLSGSDGESTFHIKVKSCRRAGDDEPPRYRIEGRWVNLSRAQRERVLRRETSLPADGEQEAGKSGK